jgi:hypothetical protein
VAAQTPHSRKPAGQQAGRTVKASVSLDVGTHAKLSAAAALEGVDKSTFMSRCITEALKGIVVFDRRKSADGAGPAVERESARGDAGVE